MYKVHNIINLERVMNSRGEWRKRYKTDAENNEELEKFLNEEMPEGAEVISINYVTLGNKVDGMTKIVYKMEDK